MNSMMKERLSRLFANSSFQRGFYLFFLILWSFSLISKTYACLTCKSSFGITYYTLYIPLASLLLLQTIFNKKGLWFIFLVIFFVITIYIAWSQVNFYNDYKIKASFKPIDLFFQMLILIPVLLVDLILFKIKPVK